MCGGEGTRLDADREKPLVRVGGVPMVDRVLDALAGSGVEAVYAAPSPATPATRDHVDAPTVETPGEGYVEDLAAAREDPRLSTPLLTVVADLPLLSAAVVDRVITAHGGGSLTVAVPAALKESLGVSVDTAFEHGGRRVAPTGLNVVGGDPRRTLVVSDRRLAVNVNRPGDRETARVLVD